MYGSITSHRPRNEGVGLGARGQSRRKRGGDLEGSWTGEKGVSGRGRDTGTAAGRAVGLVVGNEKGEITVTRTHENVVSVSKEE